MMSLLRILALFLCGMLSAQAQPPTLVVFGDSLSAGYGLARGTGWVDRLAHRMSQRGYPHLVVNASISGETSTGGRHRIAGLLQQHHPAVVIVELGANDGLRGQPIEQLHSQLAAIITACKQQGAKILIVGMRIPPNYGMRYTREFEATFVRLAKQHKLALVPFLMEGFADRRELFQNDGLHPNEQAQSIMLETIWKPLEALLK